MVVFQQEPYNLYRDTDANPISWLCFWLEIQYMPVAVPAELRYCYERSYHPIIYWLDAKCTFEWGFNTVCPQCVARPPKCDKRPEWQVFLLHPSENESNNKQTCSWTWHPIGFADLVTQYEQSTLLALLLAARTNRKSLYSHHRRMWSGLSGWTLFLSEMSNNN